MKDEMSSKEDEIVQRIAGKVREEREKKHWSLSDLAERSGVSRAMIHKIERAESSPTATILARLSAAFDMSMSQLLAETDTRSGTLIKLAEQPTWTDPETGYLRRQVSSWQLPVDIVSIELPAQCSVTIPTVSYPARRQLIWVSEGELTFTEGEHTTVLSVGDCLELGEPTECTFHNATETLCRYTVVVVKPA